MDKKALQELYLTYLKDEGYKNGTDKDGDIFFKYEGGSYYIFVDENDENYFRIVFPQFWGIETDKERADGIYAANSVNREYKCGKIILMGEEKECMWAEVGLFFNDPNDFKFFFARMIRILQGMVYDFQKRMKETE